MIRGLCGDVRQACRVLTRDWRFTLAAVVTLGLGIGVATSVFALVNIAMIRDVPFPDADRLFSVRFRDARGAETGLSYADFRDWRDRSTAFESIAADSSGFMNLGDEERAPERVRAAWVSAGTFGLLRTPPVLGRDFLPGDDVPGAPTVVIIGDGVWRRRFGADPAVIGRSVRVDDVPAVVVGVMPAGFAYPFIAEMWQPLSQFPGIAAARRDERRLGAVGRLRPGVEPAQARTELETIAAQIAQEHPATNARTSAIAYPLKDLSGDIPRPILAALVGAVSFVTLIGWVNLASLLLARSVHRAREVAIRASLGASRARIIRELLLEYGLLAGLGAGLGFALSRLGIRQLVVAMGAIEPGGAPALPYWVDVTPDLRLYLFVAVLAVVSPFVFGLLPAWHLSAADAGEVLKASARRGGGVSARRWTSGLLVVEIALTFVLLTAAGLLWRSFLDRYHADTVIDVSSLVTMRLNLPARTYRTPEQRRQFLEQLDERLASVESFDAVSMGSHIPIEFGGPVRELEIDGIPRAPDDPRPLVTLIQTGRDYFEALSVPIAQGRALQQDDEAVGREGVVIDRALADRYFGAESPIGRRARFRFVTASGPPPPSLESDSPDPAPWFTIVGITRTVPQAGPRELVRPVAYVPLRADPYPDPRIVVLVRGELAAATTTLRESVRQLDPSLPLFAIETMDTALARQRFPTRLVGTWFAFLAATALVIAAVGLYSLTAHGVAQRVHEIGVRMALGARGHQVVWLFLRRAVVQLAAGLVLGLAAAVSVGRLLTVFLGDLNARDPLTIAIVALTLGGIALLASLLPARRATRVEPAITLRAE